MNIYLIARGIAPMKKAALDAALLSLNMPFMDCEILEDNAIRYTLESTSEINNVTALSNMFHDAEFVAMRDM